MTEALGLSVGATNMVAVGAGRTPVSRRSVVTLHGQRPAEIGTAEENSQPIGAGLVLRCFVERVGDPAPLLAADGSRHRAEDLTATAVDALSRLAGYGAPVCIAVPAHWGPAAREALRVSLLAKPDLATAGVAPALFPDSATAVAALRVTPGLPSTGIVVLCDFGGSGTSISLIDAEADFTPIGRTVRHGFSGDRADAAIADELLGRLAGTAVGDPAGTAVVGSLAGLHEQCRLAKERLSEQVSTVIPVDLPGCRGDVTLTRDDVDRIIAPALADVAAAALTALTHQRVRPKSLTGVAIVGGGASIPGLGERLSGLLRTPLITTAQPQYTAALGAALLAQRHRRPDATTGTGRYQDEPTSMAPVAWAAGAASAAAGESAADGDQSATFRALAWSQDDSKAYEPVPYSGVDYRAEPFDTDETAPADWPDRGYADGDAALPWYRRPVMLFTLAAALALAAAGGLAYTLTGEHGPAVPSTGSTAPQQSADRQSAPPPNPGSALPPTAPDGDTSPAADAPSPPADTTTGTTGTTESTTTAPTTTVPTTTTEPTTTEPTTTAPTTTAPTTTAVTTTAPTTTAVTTTNATNTNATSNATTTGEPTTGETAPSSTQPIRRPLRPRR